MKKVFTVFVLAYCLNISNSIAQVQDTNRSAIPHQADANLLFLKARKQKTAAWILLGAGAGLAVTTYIIINNNVDKDPLGSLLRLSENGGETTGILLIAGCALAVASVPFFIASGKNRRKAEIMFKNESNSSLRVLHGRRDFIALAVKIPL